MSRDRLTGGTMDIFLRSLERYRRFFHIRQKGLDNGLLVARPDDFLLVAAIDFGMTYSGWGFSFIHEFQTDPTKISTLDWSDGKTISPKGPTCILIKPDGKTIGSFGYDAETRYSELIEKGEHAKWYYFHRFKMILWNKSVKKDIMLVDECGKSLPALTLFSLSIRYMMDGVLETAKKRVNELNEKDIRWVLTVPAIWNDSAKHFMRLAAQEAGIEEEKLSIALEPVAASIYCRHAKLHNEGVDGISAFQSGKKYLVVDAGGGTIDMTVHEVCFGGALKELYRATAGAWGGTMVDKVFLDFIEDLIGKETLGRYRKENMDDYIELMRDFEVKKRISSFDRAVLIRLPTSLMNFVNGIKQQTFREIIQGSSYKNQVTMRSSNELCVDADLFRSFFKQTIDRIQTCLAAALRQSATLGVDTILMVGGFSKSAFLQAAIREKFPGMEVIVPSDAGLAVLKGALIFGHRPIEVSVLKDTPMVFASDLQASPSKDLGKRSDQQTSEPQRRSWFAMPPYWEPMKPDEFVRKVCLPNTGDEFKRVSSNFIQTLDNRDILTIHRIQSTFLWEQYCVKKNEIEKINGTDGANEKVLFHGTKSDIIESICAENLDMRLAGSNVVLGHGTYFATAAKMSDCYATPDPKSGHRYMLQCRVLVGKWTKGQHDLKRPPELTSSTSGGYRRRYNSCVDNVLKPSIFCIFDHVQYYPEYVIEYD